MASVPYGSNFYGRSRYGTPGYHNAESAIPGSASVSAAPTLSFNLLGPETIAAVASVAAIGNHKFHGAANSQQNSDLLVISERLKLGIPLPSTETSSVFTQGLIVGQAGSFIQGSSSLVAVGNQIDIGSISITANSSITSPGIRIKLGNVTLSGASNSTQAGLRIKLGAVNPAGSSTSVSVGTQIDLGATSNINEVSNVSTLNPQFTTLDIPFVVHQVSGQYVYEHTTPDFTNVKTPLPLKPNYLTKLKQEDSSNVGYKVSLSQVPDGPRNTSQAHVSLRKDAANNEYLQIMAASGSPTPGGSGTNERRTLYFYSGDTSGGTPQFNGSDHPWVLPTTTITKDTEVTATISSVTITGGYQVLTVNGKPVYQYTGDANSEEASGVNLADWTAIKADGSAQTNSGPGTGATQTFAVTVATGTNSYGTGNKFYLDGSVSPTITLLPGTTYTFDQSDSSNSGHPLRLSTTPNGTHGGGSEYTTQVTTSGTPGSPGAYTRIVVTSTTTNPLHYYCAVHSGMGGQANVQSSQTFAVTVASGTNSYGTGNKFYLDGSVSPAVSLVPGNTYTFDQSHSSNTGHPLRLSTTPNGTHAGGTAYTTDVSIFGTPGQSGAYTRITVSSSTPDLNYYCAIHSGMGGTANVFSGTSFAFDSIFYSGATYYGTPGQTGAYLGINVTATTPSLYYFNYATANMGAATVLTTDIGGVESVFTVTGQSALSPNSGLSSVGVRRYFGVSSLTEQSSISSNAGLKWINQNVPQTTWTEQKLAKTP